MSDQMNRPNVSSVRFLTSGSRSRKPGPRTLIVVAITLSVLCSNRSHAADDKWVRAMKDGNTVSVHVLFDDASDSAWGYVFDNDDLSSQSHGDAPANGGNSSGALVSNNSIASLELTFPDGSSETIQPGVSRVFHTDPTSAFLVDYQLSYAGATPAAGDHLLFQEIAEPFQQDGTLHSDIANFETLIDIGGSILGQMGIRAGMRLGNDLTLTPMSDPTVFPFDTVDVSGKFMLTPEPNSLFLLGMACILPWIARLRR